MKGGCKIIIISSQYNFILINARKTNCKTFGTIKSISKVASFKINIQKCSQSFHLPMITSEKTTTFTTTKNKENQIEKLLKRNIQ